MAQNEPNGQPNDVQTAITKLFALLPDDQRIGLISDLLIGAAIRPSVDGAAAQGSEPNAEDLRQPEPPYTPIMKQTQTTYSPEEYDRCWRRAWGICGMLVAHDVIPMPRDVTNDGERQDIRNQNEQFDQALSIVADALTWLEVF